MSKKNPSGTQGAISPRKAMIVTVLSFAVVLAGVLFTLMGTRYVINDDMTWSVSGYEGFSEDITIPDSRLGMPVVSVSRQAFFLDDIRSVTLGANITELNSYAFHGCAQLESVTLNHGLVSIKDMCFSECVSLREIYIPSTVTFIHPNAFSGCDDLTILAPEGSYAAQYAADCGIRWEASSADFAG